MGVLDTFYILFRTDAKDAEDDVKSLDTAVDKLEDNLRGSDKVATLLGKKFNALATTAVAAFAGIFSVNKLIAETQKTITQGASMSVMGDILGENSVELVNWARAVESTGGTVEGFNSGIRSFAAGLNASQQGPNAVSNALSKLGVSAVGAQEELRTVLDLLPEMSREFATQNRARALTLGAEIGLDPSTVLMLMRGEEAVAALVAHQRELNPLTDEHNAQLREAAATRAEISNLVTDLGAEVTLGGLDAFADKVAQDTRARELARERASNQRTFIKDFSETIGEKLKNFFKGTPLRRGAGGPQPLPDTPPPPLDTSAIDIKGLRNELFAMADTPISAMAANVISGGVSTRTNSVTVGEVNIETQATDAGAIASEISSELENQFSNAIEQNDDGLVA